MAQDKLTRLADRLYLDVDVRDFVCDQVIALGNADKVLIGERVLPSEQDAIQAKIEHEQLIASNQAGTIADDRLDQILRARGFAPLTKTVKGKK